MDQCIAFQYCGLDDSADPEHQLCILHSFSLEKDKNLFLEAFNKHRKEKGDNFFSFVLGVDQDRLRPFDRCDCPKNDTNSVTVINTVTNTVLINLG